MTEDSLYNTLLIASAVFVLVGLLNSIFQPDVRGRHESEKYMQGIRISTRWGWAIMETPASLAFILTFALYSPTFQLAPFVFLILWHVHYINRALIYPITMSVRKNTDMSLSIALHGAIQCGFTGYMNARWIADFGRYPDSYLHSATFLVGTILFFVGFGINVHSDHVLKELRSTSVDDYCIPNAGLFRYVSSPNYLGEIIEWLGFAIACQSPPAWIFAAFTAAYLAPRALTHHKWYIEKFPEYPRSRKALVPLVY